MTISFSLYVVVVGKMDFRLVDPPLYGVPTDVVQYQHVERLQEIDQRVLSRFVPDGGRPPLPPNFDPRPAMTKYALFPMLDNRMPATIPIQPNYAPTENTPFSPNQTGPVAGFQRNVDVETELRNQVYALQKNVDQTAYVPSTASDLFHVKPVPGIGTGENPRHPLLFQQFSFAATPSIVDPKIGSELLHNSTRTQLRE